MNEFALPILLPAYPEIWLLAMASVVLVADLYLPEHAGGVRSTGFRSSRSSGARC